MRKESLPVTAVPFNTVAELPWGREKIIDAVFADRVLANVQHDRGRALGVYPKGNLELRKDSNGVQFVLNPIETRDFADTLTLVRQGIMSGASIEFVPVKESFIDGIRVLDEVTIHGVALVDTAAYKDADIQARAAHLQSQRARHTGRRGCLWLG